MSYPLCKNKHSVLVFRLLRSPPNKYSICSSPLILPRKFLMAKIGLFDLEKHFAFYGAYHSNPVNVFIHMIFVWPILFTILLILYFTPPLIQFNHVLILNIGFFFTVFYSLFYIGLDKKAGSLAALLCFSCWVSSSFLANHLGYSLAWKVVLGAQLFCWTGQFIGHGVFEKRAPALLDNLTQAFLMAPFFVLLEALDMMFRYEPYPGFHDRVKAKVAAEIKAWKDNKQPKQPKSKNGKIISKRRFLS